MRIGRLWLVTCALVSFATMARADKVDDFKDAVSKEGCESIPYGDLQSNCKSQQSDVHSWCDGGRGDTRCVKGVTNKIQAQISTEQRNLNELQEKRRNLADQRSNATDDQDKERLTSEIEALDKEIEESQKRLESFQHDLEARKDQIDKVTETINKCIDYRTAVMNVFAYATDKVRGESDDVLKPYIDQLKEKWANEKEGHEQQIQNRHSSLDTCASERP